MRLGVRVTAALLAFALPSLTPWWVTATGALFGVVVAKHLYGGIGFNIFNPLKSCHMSSVFSCFKT